MRARGKLGLFAGIVALATGILASAGSVAWSAPPTSAAHPPLRVKVVGHNSDGTPRFTSSIPTGLSPSAIKHVYNLSGLSPTSGAGAGQTIAIVDAYHDPSAASDLNKFSARYGLPQCGSSNLCFQQADPFGRPQVNSGWVLEESLDIEWAHAEAPAARIVLVEAPSNSFANLFNAVGYANGIGATEVSMSWGGSEFSGETSYDGNFTHSGTVYTASSGDSGPPAEYPSASPNVISVGGTTLNGCSGTSCSNFSSETVWNNGYGSPGGGPSAYETEPSSQSGYTGAVSNGSVGYPSIAALTGSKRGTPDVSFDGDPNSGVSVYDSTRYQSQSGWFTLGGTSVGAPNWAGILAAGGGAGGSDVLQTAAKIYGAIPPNPNLRDIKTGGNGRYAAGNGYDLATGLGSPINYP
jgi:subtilase family serine protease